MWRLAILVNIWNSALVIALQWCGLDVGNWSVIDDHLCVNTKHWTWPSRSMSMTFAAQLFRFAVGPQTKNKCKFVNEITICRVWVWRISLVHRKQRGQKQKRSEFYCKFEVYALHCREINVCGNCSEPKQKDWMQMSRYWYKWNTYTIVVLLLLLSLQPIAFIKF